MPAFGRHIATGVAHGQESTCAVRVSWRGASWIVDEIRRVSWKNEGLRGDSELQQAAASWMRETIAGKNADALCILPQRLANTVVVDFSPVHDKSKLEKMVAYQTGQMTGSSKSGMVHSFQEVTPMPGQSNPLLVAVSRQEDLAKWSDIYLEGGIRVDGLVPDGIALDNAFVLLQPTAAILPGMQLVVDMRDSRAVLLLRWLGRIQSITVFERLDANAASLARRIEETVRGWKAMHSGDAALATPEKLWVSGEDPSLDALAASLAAEMAIPAEVLGVPLSKCPGEQKNGDPCIQGVLPAIVPCLGLAAQKARLAPLNIGLLPEGLSWLRERRSQFPFLVLAFAVFLAVFSWLFASTLGELHRQQQELDAQMTLLDDCLGTAPQLRNAYDKIALAQKQLLPIAEASLRTHRFLLSIKTWQDAIPAPKNDAWCIYLADEFSFAESNAPATTSSTRKDQRNGLGNDRLLMLGNLGGRTEEPSPATTSMMPTEAMPVSAIPLLTRMYAGGVLPANNIKYHAVRELQGELNQSETFANVDDYTDFLSSDFNAAYFLPWKRFLSTYRNVLHKEYALFMMQLPFRDSPIRLP